jgi:hypothetical protein
MSLNAQEFIHVFHLACRPSDKREEILGEHSLRRDRVLTVVSNPLAIKPAIPHCRVVSSIRTC